VKLKEQGVGVETWIRELVDAFRLEQGNASMEIALDVEFLSRPIRLDEVHMAIPAVRSKWSLQNRKKTW
jgi:hypothetical protein